MSAPSFDDVLRALMSSDNNMRSQAEAYFNAQLEAAPIEITQSLVQNIADRSKDLVLRSFAGILLRRAIVKVSTVCGPDVLGQLRAALLQIWAGEDNRTILKRLSHSIAQSAADGSWPGLLPTVIAQAGSMSPSAVASLLNLIETISEYSPDDVGQNLAALGPFLASSLSAADLSVQIAGAKASGACIVCIEDEGARSAFKPALDPIISILGKALANGDEEEATIIMDHLVTITVLQPMFFKGALDGVVSAMVIVASSEGLEFSTRSMALELMVSLSESAPVLARRCPALISGIVPLAMALMTSVEETEREWVSGKYTTDNSDENYFVGEEAIERVAVGMAKNIAPLVLEAVTQFMGRPEWTHRRAAIAALSRLAEGSSTFFKTHLQPAVQMVGTALSDPSPRVQFQAIEAIGRFALLYPERTSDLLNSFATILCSKLADVSLCDRVRGHAASALINILNPTECDADVLNGHLQGVLQALAGCLQGASIEVQVPCLTLLGCAAQVSPEGFRPFYSMFMPGIKGIMQSATSEQYGELRGKAMQCVGLIGEAVGDETFAGDALEIMQLLLGAMSSQSPDSDNVFDYILPACARISKALGSKFEPFLPFVMSPIFAAASQEIQFTMVDTLDDEDAVDVEEDEDNGVVTTILNLGNGAKKKVSMNTHAVQLKNTATRLLYDFLTNMKGHLKSYITPSLDAVCTLATEKHSSDVRSSAALGISAVFIATVDAAKKGFIGVDAISPVMQRCMAKLVETLKGEFKTVARACSAEAVRDILESCYETGTDNPDGTRGAPVCAPDLSQAAYLITELLNCCGESIARRQEKVSAFSSNEAVEEDDKEALEEELEGEEELLANLVDAMGQLIKIHGEAFMTIIDSTVATAFAPFLSPTQAAPLQIVATCMIDDIIEYGGAAAGKYIPPSLGLFLNNLSSTDAVLRQCSTYGIAQIARLHPEHLASQFGAILQALVGLVTSSEARDDDNEGTTENALFAIGSLLSNSALRTQGAIDWGSCQPVHLAPLWLKNLPLSADVKEAKLAHRQLCSMIEGGDPAIIGENFSNLPEILRVLGKILASCQTDSSTMTAGSPESNMAHPETISRIQYLLKMFTSSIPQPVLQDAYSKVGPNEQKTLAAAMA